MTHSNKLLKNLFIIIWSSIGLFLSSCKDNTNKLKIPQKAVFEIESDADSVFFYSSITGSLKLFPKTGTNVYQMDMGIDSLDHAIFSYYFTEYQNGTHEQPNFQKHIGNELSYKIPSRVNQLEGAIDYLEINSSYLNEARKVSVYTPPNYSAEKSYPVIYFVDGDGMPYYASLVEKLIVEDKIQELILVGIINKKDDSNIDYRAFDHLEGFNSGNHKCEISGQNSVKNNDALLSRHENYIHFIKDELIDSLKLKYSFSEEYYDRAIYGSSNGGSFVAKLNGAHPEAFGHYIAFSIGWQSNLKTPNWDLETQPKSYLSAGRFEKGFYQTTLDWHTMLKKHNREVTLNINLSDHDSLMWEIDFQKYILQIFGK